MKKVFNELDEFHDRPPSNKFKLGGYWFRDGWEQIRKIIFHEFVYHG